MVDYVGGRGEFYTSYTPYQPEASQGNLQVFFEYQTLITQLTGMDVSNASLYDGGSAAAEAVLMCLARHGPARQRRRAGQRASGISADARHVSGAIWTCELVTVAAPARHDLRRASWPRPIDDDTACVLVQQPNFFGCVEDDASAGRGGARSAGRWSSMAVDPISLGLLKRPGDYGADIVVAEGQSLGTPMHYGGPYLGIMACREKFVRRMPGRIAGQTVDRRGKRCWVLTLQTREQHIRREKATSNICTNQGLFALRATIYLAALGPHGLRETAELCLRKAHYAARPTRANAAGCRLAFDRPFFKEFVVRDGDGRDRRSCWPRRSDAGFFAGVPLGRWYPELSDCLLVTVTEKRTRARDRRPGRCVPAATGMAAQAISAAQCEH